MESGAWSSGFRNMPILLPKKLMIFMSIIGISLGIYAVIIGAFGIIHLFRDPIYMNAAELTYQALLIALGLVYCLAWISSLSRWVWAIPLLLISTVVLLLHAIILEGASLLTWICVAWTIIAVPALLIRRPLTIKDKSDNATVVGYLGGGIFFLLNLRTGGSVVGGFQGGVLGFLLGYAVAWIPQAFIPTRKGDGVSPEKARKEDPRSSN